MSRMRLFEACDFTMGQSPSSESYNIDGRGIPFYQGNADFGKRTPVARVWCDAPKKKANAGDILLSVRAPIGAINVAAEECCIGRGLAALAPKEGRANSDYLQHFLRYIKPDLERQGTGSTFKAIGKSVLSKLELPLPSVAEQTTIANNLDLILAQQDCASESIEKLDELVKSRFVEMFGDTYLNSKGLPVARLGDLIGFITSGSRGWAKYYCDEGEYFITIKNVRQCSITLENVQCVSAPNNKEAKRTKVQEGDVLISITADLGRTGVVTREIAEHGAYINQHLACIRLNAPELTPLYLAHYLESPGAIDQFYRKNQNGVKAGLNFDLVKSLQVLLPPLALQQEFAAFVRQVDKLKFETQQAIDKLQMLYDSLAQEYFGGE